MSQSSKPFQVGPQQLPVQPHVQRRLGELLRAALTLPEDVEIHVTQWLHQEPARAETLLVWCEPSGEVFEHVSFEQRAEAITALHVLRACQARWGTLMRARHRG